MQHRCRLVGMPLLRGREVAAEECRLEGVCPDEVVVDSEQLALEQSFMLCDLSLESRECLGLCIAGKQQVHDGHVMRLAGTEGAVDERALGGSAR